MVYLNKHQLAIILLTEHSLEMFQKCSTCAKQNKTAREIFVVNSLENIWFSFLLLILIKNGIKNAVTAIISLYMVCLENPENPNSEIVMCRGQLSAESPG